jgi:hypothetical protein
MSFHLRWLVVFAGVEREAGIEHAMMRQNGADPGRASPAASLASSDSPSQAAVSCERDHAAIFLGFA